MHKLRPLMTFAIAITALSPVLAQDAQLPKEISG